MHANASASVYVVPDTVTIAFDIVAVQADPQAAMQQVDTSLAAIRALVDGLGDKDATTEIQELRKTEKPAKAAAKPDEPSRVNGPLRTHLDAPALRFSQSVDVVFRLK